MPLVSMKDYLAEARQQHYAIPLFDTPSVNAAIGTLRAAEALQAPVMLGIYNEWFDEPEIRAVCAGLAALAEDARVPVSLMLDHGRDFQQCIKAIRYGFTDVMFDGSALPFAENVSMTKWICEAAHAVGVGVEAELGHVGLGDDYDAAEVRDHFTQPALLEEFVAETGVDFLAVAIGTAHGEYRSMPKLDLDLLAQLNQISPVPLVMHGGSGLSEEQFRGSIGRGIAKVNFATHIFKTYEQRVAASAANGVTDIFTLEAMERDTFEDVCTTYLKLFGAAGKAH